MPVTLTSLDVEAAARVIAAHLTETPAIRSSRLGALIGADIHLKLESQHHTGSFKERGAVNRLEALDEAQRATGVVAMSAGNHAQAVAHHATRMGIRATIVMPKATPFTKVERTQALGAKVLLHGATLSDSQAMALSLAADEGMTLIHPYDDPLIIAGQGTATFEFLTRFPKLDDLVVPIGGGGLISGAVLAARAINPKLRITGVQCALYPAMVQALAGEPVTCGGATLAEGIAVKAPGALTMAIIREGVDRIVTVDERALETAVHLLATTQKLLVEGAGAAPLAAVLGDPDRYAGRAVGLMISGGNIDARLMAQVLTRGLVSEGRLVCLRVDITDTPGALAQVTGLLGDAGANIVEIHHQRLIHDVPVKMAEVDVVIETRDAHHVDAIIAALSDAGLPTRRLANVP